MCPSSIGVTNLYVGSRGLLEVLLFDIYNILEKSEGTHNLNTNNSLVIYEIIQRFLLFLKVSLSFLFGVA